jgi:gluconate 2-dehydrogenase gamma chain
MMAIARRELLKKMSLSMGGLVSVTTIAAVVSGCEKPVTVDLSIPWEPTYFDKTEAAIIHALADIVLPATETPGATEAGTPQLTEQIVQDVFEENEQAKFKLGFSSLGSICQSVYKQKFLELGSSERIEVATLLNLANTARTTSDKQRVDQFVDKLNGDTSISHEIIESAKGFFAVCKELTVLNYYRSEVGATQELHYLPIPGAFDGCAPMENIGKTWATVR